MLLFLTLRPFAISRFAGPTAGEAEARRRQVLVLTKIGLGAPKKDETNQNMHV